MDIINEQLRKEWEALAEKEWEALAEALKNRPGRSYSSTPTMNISNDYDELLAEFEKMLSGEIHSYDTKKKEVESKLLSKEAQEAYKDFCKHEFISKGVSPFTGHHYIKCKHCNISEAEAKYQEEKKMKAK